MKFTDDIPEGFPWPDLDEEPQLSAPGVDPDMIKYFSEKLGGPAPSRKK